ncbi:alkaline phosphatase family protein [Pelagicoccus sp. SDUM812003]|uniref:alkaline phosphatase family protein n=1 Tax=Pelagicoccus sp. SDUM812003 TaxID=3041267 RepID=UPI00280FFDFA|nr:alkaline phosphatase family protein [Pelagicoccus sp. SDUM812003]MDQ8202832.1 alkaline phosphatase family protein [Pelagicoccus sp. SDUM812003]
MRLAVLNVVGLTQGHIGARTPRIKAFAETRHSRPVKPAFPAVTCTAQSNYLTGKPPKDHGIVANGWYNRQYSEVHFWKQSNHLVTQPKLWQTLKRRDPNFTCAKLFWWYNMYSSADYTITPRPMYPADGRKVFDIYTQPMDMRERIKAELGDFPFFTFWGPKAGIDCSRWIAESAKWTEKESQPTLSLVYLPHLDYNLQRLGPNHPDIGKDLQLIDEVVGDLIAFYQSRDVEVVLLSEYGITEVDRPIHINRALRQKGWITIKDELGREQLDCGASRAFAIADHQVAHVYLNDPSIASEVRSTLEALPGIAKVLDRSGRSEAGIEHARSGDFIAVADESSWFTYYYWLDDAVAPDFARCVDIHRKPGYDPVELFIDPKLRFPPAKIATFLLKKKLGFRALLDVIPLDASLVKGSHGCTPKHTRDWPVYISSQATEDEALDSLDIHDSLLRHFD